MAAEVLKLKDFDYHARIRDVQQFNQRGCKLPGEHYLEQAMNVLKERDAVLVRVYNKLMERRVNPLTPRFKDTDGLWKQVTSQKRSSKPLCESSRFGGALCLWK